MQGRGAGRGFWVLAASMVVIAACAVVLWLAEQRSVAATAGLWTVKHVSGSDHGGLPAEVGAVVRIEPNGYLSIEGRDARTGIVGRSYCGWNCYTIGNFRAGRKYRAILSSDGATLAVSDMTGFAMTMERKPN